METRIKELRLEQNLTRKALAKKSGVSTRQLMRVERSEQNTNVKTLQLIANALGSTVGYLLYETDNRAKQSSNIEQSSAKTTTA